jgi:hypothetical protein
LVDRDSNGQEFKCCYHFSVKFTSESEFNNVQDSQVDLIYC